jgi:putative flippase GtrA
MDAILHLQSVNMTDGTHSAWPTTSGRRLARFGVVGTMGTLIYYVTLWVMVEAFRLPVLLASSISFLIVTLENYVLHYTWTFMSTDSHGTALPRFVMMSAIGFSLNWGIMYLGVERLSLNYLLIQGIAIVIVVMWNFLVSSWWIFGARRVDRDCSDLSLGSGTRPKSGVSASRRQAARAR